MELGTRDAFNERVRRPRTLLELELSPLDFEIVATSAQPLELNEQLARTVLAINRGRSRPQRPDPKDRDGYDEPFAGQKVHTVTPPGSSDFLRDTQQRTPRARIAVLLRVPRA